MSDSKPLFDVSTSIRIISDYRDEKYKCYRFQDCLAGEWNYTIIADTIFIHEGALTIPSELSSDVVQIRFKQYIILENKYNKISYSKVSIPLKESHGSYDVACYMDPNGSINMFAVSPSIHD